MKDMTNSVFNEDYFGIYNMYNELDQREATVRTRLEKSKPKESVGGRGNERNPSVQ